MYAGSSFMIRTEWVIGRQLLLGGWSWIVRGATTGATLVLAMPDVECASAKSTGMMIAIVFSVLMGRLEL
jgi:hypothetical protein